MNLRDNNIELFRALLMLGICVLHAITMCGHSNQWLSGPLSACVDGFVFISGYYGVKFRPSKIIKLYVLGIYCILTGVGVSYVVFGCSAISGGMIEYVVRVLKYHWFLHAYVVMMMLAPIVNYAIGLSLKEDNRRQFWIAIVPILLLVFGWGGMVAMPGIGKFMPVSAGITAYSGITLFGVYVVARIFHYYELERKVTTKHMLIAFPILLLLAGPCCFYEYSTPVALLLATFMFVVFKRIHVTFSLNLLTPSLFAVYFYHTFKHGNRWVETALEGCLIIGIPLIASYFLAGLIVFVGCIAFDVPRRLMLMVIKNPIDRIMCKIDSWYEGLFDEKVIK